MSTRTAWLLYALWAVVIAVVSWCSGCYLDRLPICDPEYMACEAPADTAGRPIPPDSSSKE